MRARKVVTRDGYRRYRTPPPRPRVVAGCLALALMVGALFAAEGDRLGATVAGLGVAAFLVISPRVGPPLAGFGTYAAGALMMGAIAAERLYWGATVGVAVFGTLAALCVLVSLVFVRVPGRGGVIR